MKCIEIGPKRCRLLLSDGDHRRLVKMIAEKGGLSLTSDGYAYYARSDNGRRHGSTVHRMIAEWAGRDMSRQIDHRDGHRLNCQRRNLRAATHGQQTQNSKHRHTNKYGFKGVSLNPYCATQYIAQIQADRKKLMIGSTFTSPEDAARAYDKMAKKLFGRFARLNFPAT